MSEAPEPDRLPDVPHPRETLALCGQDAAEAAFLQAHAAGRLQSGWLLVGPRGVGKATLAYRIAAFLLSEAPADGLFGAPPPPERLDLPPGHPDRRLILAGAHPRLFVLRRATDEKTGRLSAQITVDEARKLRGFFQLSAADGGRRVVIVDAADEMNTAAANALLKLLEEPPPRTTLLLISHRPGGLLPTIRSRCRLLRLGTLGPEDLAVALSQTGTEIAAPEALAALAGGAVGRAVQLAQGGGLALYAQIVALMESLPRLDRAGAIALAESCAGRGAEERLALAIDLIDLFLARAARAGVMGPPATQGAPGEARLLARLAPDPQAGRAFAAAQEACGTRARQGRAVNLDPAALILDICLKIEDTARRAVPA